MTSAASGELALRGFAALETTLPTLQNRVSPALMRCAQGPHIVPLTHNHDVTSVPKTEGGEGIMGDHHRTGLGHMRAFVSIRFMKSQWTPSVEKSTNRAVHHPSW